MINTISESTLRIAAKIDPHMAIQNKEVEQKKAEEVRQARPVEKSEAGGQSKLEQRKKEESSRYQLEEDRVVFKKYNKTGDLVYRLPPAHKPVDQRA